MTFAGLLIVAMVCATPRLIVALWPPAAPVLRREAEVAGG